jgi:hypothetical protein
MKCPGEQLLQAPPTTLEQVMAIRGFIILFPMSPLWHVGDRSFFADAAVEFMAHRGDDFNGCLPMFYGRIGRLSVGEGRLLTI